MGLQMKKASEGIPEKSKLDSDYKDKVLDGRPCPHCGKEMLVYYEWGGNSYGCGTHDKDLIDFCPGYWEGNDIPSDEEILRIEKEEGVGTFAERAEELLAELDGSSNVIGSIVRVLKEQDRDTRHACAEAVNTCGARTVRGLSKFRDQAHAACINANWEKGHGQG